MRIKAKTLKELPGLAFDQRLRRRFLERYASGSECTSELRSFARWLQRLGFGLSVLPSRPCTGAEISPEVSGEASGSNAFAFVDDRGEGFIQLGSLTKVYRYAAKLPEPVEWRRWASALKLETQQGTLLTRWREGWLTLSYDLPREPRGPIVHRFLTFGPEFDLRASSLPWTLPSGERYQAQHLSHLPDGNFLLVSHNPDTGQSTRDIIAADTIVSSLISHPQARLELQDPVDLHNLRYLTQKKSQ